MGYTSYSTTKSVFLSSEKGYNTITANNIDSVFTQTKKKRAHESMLPSNMSGFREARDSEVHPNTVPIQIYIDVTGSMMDTPVYLIKEGLNHIITKLIQAGIKDVTLMIAAIGDHECDSFPLQIGQFESGDEELDLWLTRIYLEKGGGGNSGESYLLAWQMAADFVKTDSWDKRKKKGFVFTIGDEPTLMTLSSSAQKEIFGDNLVQSQNYIAEELYKKACEINHVFHIHLNHQTGRDTNLNKIMGQRCINTSSVEDIGDTIVRTVLNNIGSNDEVIETDSSIETKEQKITL